MIARGIFRCPQCGTDRNYSHKAWRTWFTLFFIPVIPLKQLGDAVECESCGTSFKPVVLTMPTTSQLEDELLEAFLAAVVTVLRANPTPAAATAAVGALSSFAGHEWNEAQLETDVGLLDVSDLAERLARLGDSLTEQGKERFLALCTEVAATGGVIDSDARAALDSIAGNLGMTAAHTRGVIAQVLEEAQA